jgi:hypothetical protein
MNVPFRAPESCAAFPAHHTPFWTMSNRPELFDFLPTTVFDRFLPVTLRRTRQRQRLVRELEPVLQRNVENLRWSIRQNLADAFRRFDLELDEQFTLSLEATRGAISAALDRRDERAETAAEEIENLERTLADLEDVREKLGKHG